MENPCSTLDTVPGPMAEKPLLLLDVDGVLCPFGFRWAMTETGIVMAETTQADVPEGYEYNDEWNIYVSKENARRVTELMLDFEVVWCTGWVKAANEIIGPLHGLPEFPVVDLMEIQIDDPIHWKGTAIQEFVGDKPFAFVDDDIHDRGFMWANHRNKITPTLWIKPDHRVGLTDEHVSTLREWAKEVVDGGGSE